MAWAPKSDGVIGGDDASIVQSQTAGEDRSGAQERKSRRIAADGRSAVVIGAEAGEHGVGLGQSGGAGETEFADQTI